MSFFWSTVIFVSLVSWSTTAAEAISEPNSVATCHDGSDSSEDVVVTCSSSDRNDALMEKPNLAIKINGETYRLDEEPAPDSAIVVSYMKRLSNEAVNLEELIISFGRLGVLVNLAYNGAVAAGPKYIDFQLDIQTIGHSLADLFDQSVLALSNFKMASEGVLSKVHSMYYFLIKGRENLAIETLKSIIETSEDMTDASRKLQNTANKNREKIDKVSRLIQRERSKISPEVVLPDDILNKQRRKDEVQVSITALHRDLEDAIDKENKARIELEEYEKNNKEAINRMGNMGIMKNFVNIVASLIHSKPYSEEEYAEIAKNQAKTWKENAHHAQLQLNLHTERRIRFEKQMDVFARKIMDIDAEDQDMAKTVVHALHVAIGELNEVYYVMQDAILFWKNWEQSCKGLDGVIKYLGLIIREDSQTDGGKNSLELWTNNIIKETAMNYSASWVAMKIVCSDSIEHVKLTRIELKKMMLANPTREESIENIKSLAKKLHSSSKHTHGQG